MAKTPPLPEAPVELIRDAAASYDQVQVRIKRQTAKGTWATCGPTVLKPTNELVSLDDWIREMSGGGRYRVETFRPDDPTQPVVPPFWVEIEGPSRPIESTRRAMSGPAQPSQPAAGGMAVSPMQWPMPAWRGRWGDDDDSHIDPSKFMSQTPDAIAMEQTRALREELKELRTQREQERAQHAEELRRLTDKISEMVQKHADETSRREREAFEARIAARLEGGSSSKIDYVGIATAMAPVVIAMITSGKDRQALLADMQQRSLEMQQSNTTTMLSTLTGQKQTDTVKMIEALTGIAMPIITKMMDEKSPSAVAKLIGAMGESNMTTLSIVSQFMQQMQGDDPNPPAWMQLVNEGIKSMVDVAERSMEVAGGQPRMQPGANPQQMPQGPSPTPQQTLPADASPEDIANAIVNAPTVPKELTTKAWFSIFVALHRGDDPKAVAKKIADAIEAGEETNAMPPMFKGFFESSAQPSTMLVQLLQQIPVWQAQDYCRALCEAFDTLYAESDGRGEVINHGPNGRDNAAPFAGPSATQGFQQPTRG